MSINILPTSLANRISAGEVVERPASIIKELVDNGIDAGASELTIEIRNGGIDYIRVVDNGCGIEEKDVKKAFLPHATSKIKTIDDLDNIFTLGFRGEALASIASVSQVYIETKTKNSELASTLEIAGGVYGAEGKTAGKDGTTIEVKNLFYNTPARRKFLRKPKQEESEITNVVSRYILAHPTIKIKYFVEDELVYNSKGSGLFDAINCVYGIETAQNVMEVDGVSNNIHIHGYVSKLSFTKPNTTYQTLLVNNRYVVDESVSKAVYMAYEEFLMTRQFPFFVLNIDMPYSDVDVNVHPNKLTIKFSKPHVIFDFVYNLVRKKIYDSIKPKEFEIDNFVDVKEQEEEVVEETYETKPFSSNEIVFKQSFGDNISMFDKVATNPNAINKIQEEERVSALNKILENNKGFNKSANSSGTNNVLENVDKRVATSLGVDTSLSTQDIDKNMEFNNSTFTQNVSDNSANLSDKLVKNNEDSRKDENKNFLEGDKDDEVIQNYQPIFDFVDYKIIGEIFSEFIILEHKDKMLLLDFHAGHERLIYDRLLKEMANKKIVIQDLLVPYIQTLTPKEIDYILQFKENFKKLGFDIDQFSSNAIRISSVPLLVKDINLKQFVDDLVNDLNNFKPKIAYELDHYLMRTACRSAVKAGQKLNELQIKELLKNLDLNHPVLLCPHGRPVITVVSRAQIEKWFKRIV